MPQDHSTEEYLADLSLLHIASARRLRQLCQSNAGIYIKAAQLMSTAQAIPQEYRKCVQSWSRLFSEERSQSSGSVCYIHFTVMAQLAMWAEHCCIIPCRRLEVLQDRAEPRDFEEVQLAVMQQLGAPIEELFAEFEPEARAAASLAQACRLCAVFAHPSTVRPTMVLLVIVVQSHEKRVGVMGSCMPSPTPSKHTYISKAQAARL